MNPSYAELYKLHDKIIQYVDHIMGDFKELLCRLEDEGLLEKYTSHEQLFENFRSRAKTELLSIAFFGAFSSGKSYLISGLQNRIDYHIIDDEEHFDALLPASARHTSSCPVAVEPLKKDEEIDRFWVTFEDSHKEEERSPAAKLIIQSYVTDLPNSKVKRIFTQDYERNVVCAKVGLTNAVLGARFYDLPGFGAIGANYTDVVKRYVQQSDCIVYVASADRPLDDTSLDLLRGIYNHYRDTFKSVFFVLTKIDSNTAADGFSGEPGWKEVQKANNEFLTRHFLTENNEPDVGFIGEGFRPISVFYEAKAKKMANQHFEDEHVEHMLEKSGMDALRLHFKKFLESTSGPIHLTKLSYEIRRFLWQMSQDISHLAVSEATPLKKLQTFIKAEKAKRKVLLNGRYQLSIALNDLSVTATHSVFSHKNNAELAFLLKEKLYQKIQESNVLRDAVIHDIETDKASIVRSWLRNSDDSLVPRWSREWNHFVNESNKLLEKLFSDSEIAFSNEMKKDEISSRKRADMDSLDIIDRIQLEYQNQKPQTMRETITALSGTWQSWSVMAGIGGSALIGSSASAGTIPAMAALGPIGWSFMAIALIGASMGGWTLSQQKKERRQQLLDSLGEYSNTILKAYLQKAKEFLESYSDMLFDIIDEEIKRLDTSIKSSEHRLKTGENENREKSLNSAKSLQQRCKKADYMINRMFDMAARLQPNITDLLYEDVKKTTQQDKLNISEFEV